MKYKIDISINLDEISDDFDKAVKFLVKNKVKFVEIRTINRKNIVDFDIEDVKKVAAGLSKNDLKVSAIASPLFKWYLNQTGEKVLHDNFSFNPALNENQKREYILKTIKIAKIFGTKNVRVFSNLKQDGLKSKDLFRDAMFKYMLQEFSKARIVPLLENEPVCLISKADDYLATLQKYGKQGLKAWWDIANSYDVGDLVDGNLIKNLAPFVEYLHVKDKLSKIEKTYVPLGKGYINYKRIFSDLIPVLEKRVFSSIETHVRSNKIQATKISLDYLNALLHQKRVSYAIIGAGRISKKHSLAFKENINSELRGVFDINRKKAVSFSSENDVKNYQNLNDLLSDQKVKVVDICTPHSTHIKIARRAIAANKIVISEKPFSINSKELEKYLKDNKSAGNTYVIFQNLFNEPVRQLIDNFRKGKFGKIQFFAANIRWSRNDDYFKDWHGKIQFSGGSLFNQAIHSIQLLLLLLGNQIKNVSYQKRTVRKGSEVEDIGNAVINLKNGAFGHLELCLVNKGENLESSFYLSGTNGSMKIGGKALNSLVYEYFDSEKNKRVYGGKSISDIYGNGHKILIKTLSDKILGKKDVNQKYLIKAKDVLPIIRFIEKLYGNS